jgi:hypothetical protein
MKAIVYRIAAAQKIITMSLSGYVSNLGEGFNRYFVTLFANCEALPARRA